MSSDPFVYVLGVAQDGGHPHPGCLRGCCLSGDGRPVPRHLPSCLGVVDPEAGVAWLIDATPALPEQLARLREVTAAPLSGVLLTHAHMGHYLGLAFLGREGMGLRGLPLGVQPRMAAFLAANAPWSQLVALDNVRLQVAPRFQLSPRVSVEALRVPHRDEHSETVAFRIRGPRRSVLWLPDIDAWEGWDLAIEDVLAGVAAAWIDGTFWADGELARDMGEVPHPRVAATLARLAPLPAAERAKVRFVHLNHTNPALDPDSAEAARVRDAGMAVAREGERVEV